MAVVIKKITWSNETQVWRDELMHSKRQACTGRHTLDFGKQNLKGLRSRDLQ
jgi:hypothetical protein